MKRIIPFLLFLIGLTAMQAERVDSTTARRVAQQFWATHAPKHLQQLTLINLTAASGFEEVYLWGCDSGFVVVAGSTLVRPVLAYGMEGAFDVDNRPVQLIDWMADYASVMQQMELDHAEQDKAVAAEWERLLRGHSKTAKRAVPPLVSTKWNQGGPYNLLCPYDSVLNRRSVAGCVAVAMAQLLKYWNYPLHGKRSHSYSHNAYGLLEADMVNTTYDWDHMPDYQFNTAEERQAVATLIYHCGVSVNMIYTPYESSSYTCQAPQNHTKAITSFVDFFDYQPTLECKYREQYNDNDWAQLLMNELDAGRPMLYTGTDPSGGHAFVVDGYDAETLFHINWGWGGAYDGYYAMGALSPGGGGAGGNATYTFNGNNSAIVGLIPNGVLKCSPDRLSTGRAGGTMSTFVSSSQLLDTTWYAHCDADWVHITPDSGDADTTLVTITIDTNHSDLNRSTVVTFTQGRETAYLNIRQNECGIIDTFPYAEGFEDSLLCWTYASIDKANMNSLGIVSSNTNAHRGNRYFSMGSPNEAAHYDQYLISPYMELGGQGTLQLYYQRNYSYPEQFEVLLSDSDGSLASFDSVATTINITKMGWKRITVRMPAKTHYVAVHYFSEHQRTMGIDDISITVETPPAPPVQGIGGIASDDITLWTEGRTLHLDQVSGRHVAVYDMAGRIIATRTSASHHLSLPLPATGVYLVRIDGLPARKVVLRF
ncbi:MAG: C10 family peptidase [Bacteroidales bacterium]|nr:C10 family peptidase [Bacteroidales bacterium]